MAAPRKLAVPVQMDKAELGFLLRSLEVSQQFIDRDLVKLRDDLKAKLEAARKSLD